MPDLYHERQSLSLCAIHAVNNLLQHQRYTKLDFDQVCLQLSPSVLFNPHRSILRIGNFDVNVVSMLLQQNGSSVAWHDARTALDAARLDALTGSGCGVLWNVEAGTMWSRVFGGRHWITLVRKGGVWVNLDSKLERPLVVGDSQACAKLLASHDDAHVLIVEREPREGRRGGD